MKDEKFVIFDFNVVSVFAFRFCTWNFGVFKKMGINGPRPWPIIGTSLPLMTKV